MIKIGTIVTTGIIAITLSASAMAAEALNAEEAKALFSGKTFNGLNIAKDREYRIYSDPGGEATFQTTTKTKKATWEIKPDGIHCMHFKKKSVCGFIVPAGDGVYHKMIDGEHTNTLSNFVEGNQL